MTGRILFSGLFCICIAVKAAVIWQEDFSSCINSGITGAGAVNYPAGITNWSTDVRACATPAPGSGSTGDYFMAVSTGGGRMEAVNLDGEAVWFSAAVNISSYTNVSLSVSTSETGSSTSTNKYVKIFYRLNSGAEIAFAVNPVNLGNWGSATAVQSNLCGLTVQIVVRINNPNTADKSVFDSVTVSGGRTASTNSTVTDPVPVCGSSRIAGKFHGWSGHSVFKLENGQFWRQCAPGIRTADPALFHPDVTVTNILGRYRLYVTNTAGYVTVSPVSVAESSVHGFAGLHYQNIYRLTDGTFWRQISFENIPVSGAAVICWRWTENNRQILRFLDRNHTVIGTCTAERLAVFSEDIITNSFTGLHYANVYQLSGGQKWMQVSFENISTNFLRPTAALWTEGGKTSLTIGDAGTCTVINPDSDEDGDGISNHHEILAGSDPLDTQSRFELRQTERCILNWTAVEGRIYAVEWTPALAQSFQPLETNIVWPQNSWTDNVHSAEIRGYYRITVRPVTPPAH